MHATPLRQQTARRPALPKRLLIQNGILALPAGPLRADILCDAHRIVAVGSALEDPSAATFDATGLTLGPGFIDVHVHGGGGHSFFSRDPEQVRAYARWAPAHGVTGFIVSTLGRDHDDTVATLRALAPAIGHLDGAEPLGFHLEGPFLNPERRGAFPAAMLRPPSLAQLEDYLVAAAGHLRHVTVAPELPGAREVVRAVADAHAVAAMGHTDATTGQARQAIADGVEHITHLFNAMRPFHQREGGPIAAALLDRTVTCELICDGAHVAPEALRLAYRILGPIRTVIVTDNLDLAGTPRESGSLAGDELSVSGATARKPDGTIAGSVATMDHHFRNAAGILGADTQTAFRLCSTNPAHLAGAFERKGALEHGYDADIVMLDEDHNVAATVCRGSLAFEASPGRFRHAPA